MKFCLVLIGFCLVTCTGLGQDSSRIQQKAKKLAKDVYEDWLLVKHPSDDTSFMQKSQQQYEAFAGRVIRHTEIHKLAFGENVMDTNSYVGSKINRVANRLQTGTKSYILRQFLFVKPGQALDPFQVADNERLLRQLDFIKDARIEVVPVGKDSVDLLVKVRDVFSIGVKATASGISDLATTLYDANLFGWAQRLELTLRYDHDRSPHMGTGFLYRKYNIAGTFVNAGISYSTINTGLLPGDEYENTILLNIDRPLYTPNAKWAGGLQVGKSASVNRTNKPDSVYHAYGYTLNDIWLGYNFGTRVTRFRSRYEADSRKRRFLAFRYFDQHFSEKPLLPYYSYRFAEKQFLLGSFTWYQQNYYRTNYIYGFGRTEDLPVGSSQKLVMGLTRTDSLRRFYAGWEFNHWVVLPRDHYFVYTVALGTNYNKQGFTDNSLLAAVNWISPLIGLKDTRLRQYASVSYAGISNYRVYDQLYLDNDYGLGRFRTDSVFGTQRLSAGMETVVFTKWKLLGFKFGFFAFAKGSLLAQQEEPLFHGTWYSALGGGFRTRNENLIFGTIEGRFTYYPRTYGWLNNYSITFTSNLRLRFNEAQVQGPWFATIR